MQQSFERRSSIISAENNFNLAVSVQHFFIHETRMK
jgi:hypothetical protein